MKLDLAQAEVCGKVKSWAAFIRICQKSGGMTLTEYDVLCKDILESEEKYVRDSGEGRWLEISPYQAVVMADQITEGVENVLEKHGL